MELRCQLAIADMRTVNLAAERSSLRERLSSDG